MDDYEFKKIIRDKLDNLPRKKVIRCAWLCAMRALPCLGISGNFRFWKKTEVKKHLYSCFYILDASYAVSIANATNAVYAANDAYINALNLQNIILQDIEDIQNDQPLFHDISIYGEVWENFQTALKKEGCEYWGKLYQDIFDSGFRLDEKALKRRLSVPIEIREQGAATVADCLVKMEKEGARHLNETRLIILGEKGAGKTCLARRLINPYAPMTDDNESTAGVETSLWNPDEELMGTEEKMNVRIWDFAGHVLTHAAHRFFLSERCLYIIVYDGRTERRNDLEYWFDHVKNYGGGSNVFLLINTRDDHEPDVPIYTLQEKYPNLVRTEMFNVKSDEEKLNEYRRMVVENIKRNPLWNDRIPTSDFEVKKNLEQLFQNKDAPLDYINEKQFREIARKHHTDEPESLLRNLHVLGVCLHYPNLKDLSTLVLNPEWITQGVYDIINWGKKNKTSKISLSEFERIFENNPRYPREKHEFIFQLMQHYQLAYETEEEHCLVIPFLLEEDRPRELPDFGESGLKMRFTANHSLSPDTITRFIVHHHQEIKKDDFGKSIVWRYGVLLKDDQGTTALVREDKNTIMVSVRGKNQTDQTNYLTKLRKTLNEIFETYKTQKPELKYWIERNLWLDEKDIAGYAEAQKPYYDPNTRSDIDCARIVNIYDINMTIVNSEIKSDIWFRTTYNFR